MIQTDETSISSTDSIFPLLGSFDIGQDPDTAVMVSKLYWSNESTPGTVPVSQEYQIKIFWNFQIEYQ